LKRKLNRKRKRLREKKNKKEQDEDEVQVEVEVTDEITASWIIRTGAKIRSFDFDPAVSGKKASSYVTVS
jgi:U3 small nucleolar RNA-associated protein 12